MDFFVIFKKPKDKIETLTNMKWQVRFNLINNENNE